MTAVKESVAESPQHTEPPDSPPVTRVVRGSIVRRRCLGRHLAFADVRCEEERRADNTGDADADANGALDDSSSLGVEPRQHVLQVAFLRASPHWDTSRDDTFPTKNSSLPFGAVVKMTVVDVVATESAAFSAKEGDEGRPADKPGPPRNGPSLVVRSWTMLSNPNDDARRKADVGGGGMSCSTYLRARKEAHQKVAQSSSSSSRPGAKKNSEGGRSQRRPPRRRGRSDANGGGEGGETVVGAAAAPNSGEAAAPEPSSGADDVNVHGDRAHKALRAGIFARWLVGTFGADALREGTGVLDVAGGRGDVSVELSAAAGVPCTVIDPLVRKRSDKGRSAGGGDGDGDGEGVLCAIGLSSRDRKRLIKAGGPVPSHVAAPFDVDFARSSKGRAALVEGASCLVAMHPDEATESVLDAALEYGKSVAIVPCCVFPTLFPHRRLVGGGGEEDGTPGAAAAGRPVTTYGEFLDYLLAKDERLTKGVLPFEGRNEVVYLKV